MFCRTVVRLVSVTVLCLWSLLTAEYQFEEFQQTETQECLKELLDEFPPLNESAYKSAIKELASLLKTKQWSKGFTKAKAVFTYPHIDPETAIEVAIFCHNFQKSSKKKHYDASRIAKCAAHIAYTKATSNLQKAQALMLYLSQDEWRCTPQTLDEVKQLYSIEKLRNEDKRFQGILAFEYLDHTIEESPQGAILHLNFSQNLNITEPENYLEISPNVDGFVHVEGKTITISGFQAGIEYNIKLRPGIKSILDEKTRETTKVGFFVKDLKPVISFPNNTYIYPKQANIRLPIRAINIDKAKATLYCIPDRNIVNNLGSLMQRSWNLSNTEKLFSTDLDFNGNTQPNQTIAKNLDATAVLPELKPGIYVLEVRQKGVLEYYNAQVADQWFIVTDIGLTTFTSDQALVVHAKTFSSAKPLKDIQLDLISADNDILGTATTDENGFAEFSRELLNGKAGKKPVAIFAKNKSLGFSFISLASPGFDFSDRGVKGRPIRNNYDAMVFCERGVYRPGEKINVAAILRNGHGKEVPESPLTIIIKSPKGTEIKRETLTGNELGTYCTDHQLPEDCVTGIWSVEALVDPTKAPVGSASFRVDDFSPNKIALTLTALNKTTQLGTTQTCTLNAHYLYGAPVQDRQAILEAKITPDPRPFDQWKDFHFGLEDDKFISQVITGSTVSITDGKAELNIAIPNDLSCSQALRVDLSSRLTDTTSTQQAATSATLLTQDYIVGVREKATNNADNVEIEVITVDSNGKLVASDDLEYTFFKSEAKYQWYKDDRSTWNYQRIYQDKPIKTGKITTKNDAPVLLSFKHESAQSHALTIKKKDGTKLAKFHIGEQHKVSKDRPDNLNIIPVTKTVNIGDTVTLKVDAPFAGEATIIAGLNSVQLKDAVHLKQGVNVLKIPTNKTWGSGAYVMVSLVRPLDKKIADIQAKRAVGIQWIQIDPKDISLEINLDLPTSIKPQHKLKIPVQVKGVHNQTTRVMLAIVDEGVLGLTNFTIPNPIEYFFGQRALGIEMRDVYGHIIDPIEADVIDMRSGGGALMLRRGAFVPKTHDKILSFFDGDIQLNAEGKTEVVMDIPVFFGKLRVYALAITKNKMGSTIGEVIVKDNLVVDPNLPSFLTVGDENTFNIRIENTTDQPMEVEVKVNLEKSLATIPERFQELGRRTKVEERSVRLYMSTEDLAVRRTQDLKGERYNAKKQTIHLAAKEQKYISVDAIAKQIGEGIVKIEAKGEGVNYQHSTSVEVRSAFQPVLISNMFKIKPGKTVDLTVADMLKGLETLDTQADLFITNQGPWNLGKIQKWLINYPFGCTQQVISKGFAAISALKQCKDKVNDPDRAEYQRICYEVIAHLNEHQNSTGGWGMWPRENDDDNLSAYALEMLFFAESAGLTVPKVMLEKSLSMAKQKINSLSWKIKQGREKADSIAWIVKLCAQTKEIDTATTRYCFDEYFKQCDSVVAKSLFVAAMASIQDLLRVQKGIQELNDLVDKGIAMPEMAAVAAHLTQFTEITVVKQLVQRLEKTLHKSIGNNITHLDTQTLAMLLKANFASEAVTAKGIKVSINDVTFNEKNYLAHTMKPLKDLQLKNHGEDPLWLFSNSYGIATEPVRTHENDLTASRTFYKVDGTKITAEDISIGERMVVVIEGKITKAAVEGYLMLSEWLPAGFTHTNTVVNYQWLKDTSHNPSIQKRHDRYIASWKQDANTTEFKVAYEVIATQPGKFQQPGLHIENMANPAVYATYTPTTVVVNEKSNT